MAVTATEIMGIVESVKAGSLEEAAPKKVVSFSGGKRHFKLACPKGYKVNGNKCSRMSTKELRDRKKGASKAAKKRRSHAAQIARKRARTMQKRHAAHV